MMNNPKISVIIPVYNVESYLEKCVKSVVFQSYRNLEIILVDDGSTDKSDEMCDQLSKKYKNVFAFHKENGGLSSARNYGMEKMTGEYFFFIDSDDYIYYKTIEKMYFALKFLDVDIVECEYAKVTSDYGFNYTNQTVLRIDSSEEFLSHVIKWKEHYPMAWNKLYKTSVFGKYRFREGRLNEDEFFINDWIVNTKKIGYLSLPLYYYRIRKDSIMGQPFTIKRADAFDAYVNRYLIIKESYPKIINQSLWHIGTQIISKIKLVEAQNNDKDYKIRKRIIEFISPIYADILSCKTLSEKDKNLLIKYKIDINSSLV